MPSLQSHRRLLLQVCCHFKICFSLELNEAFGRFGGVFYRTCMMYLHSRWLMFATTPNPEPHDVSMKLFVNHTLSLLSTVKLEVWLSLLIQWQHVCLALSLGQ